METILTESNEFVIRLVAECLKNLENEKGLSEFTDDLYKHFMELGNKTLHFMLDYAEEIIFKLSDRKEQYTSLEKDDRQLLTIFGKLDFVRRYYENKETKEKTYLLDKYFRIEKKERMLANVEEKLVEEAIVTTYEHAGELAVYGEKVTRQTVKNKIKNTKVVDFSKISEDKKKVRLLYIIADEDHVALQKGGIEEPRFVMVYENFAKIGKRVQLLNKKYFGGLYKGRIDDLWEEVATYIENTYDTEYLERVYISGDGASWIKTGIEWVIKSKYVIDRFHLKQAVNSIVGKETRDIEDKDLKREYKMRIYRSLHRLDFKELKEIVYEILAEEMEQSKRERKAKLLNYLLNNKTGITNLYKNLKELHGCSAEGHVSHIYSDRLSSRPKGWCIPNLDNMSRLRIYKANAGKVKELIEDRNKVVKFEEIKKIEKSIKKAMKNINFNSVAIPIMTYGNEEERIFFRKLLSYKKLA